jgi:hypothetical protein
MSQNLLIVLSVVEIVALVVVLAIYLLIVARQLRQIASILAEVTWGARAVERQLLATRSNVGQINWALEDAATVLPGIVEKAESLGTGAVRS